MPQDFSSSAHDGLTAVRARTLLTLAGERPARSMAELEKPLARLDDGVIVARNGLILFTEPFREYRRRPDAMPPGAVRDLGDVILIPGPVNCHTHLELSHMAGKTRLGNGFRDWVASLAALDRDAPKSAAMDLDRAVAALAASGTAAVGDISSRMPRQVLASLRSHKITPRVFLENIGHDPAVPVAIQTEAARDAAFSLAGHALYSTAAESMVAARQWCAARGRPFSLHLAEHEDEETCLRDGRGEFHARLRERLVPASWKAPGKRPVEYAASLGLLAPGTLAVHCVCCDRNDIALLAASGASVCLCPRSNAAIGVGEAPARAFAEAGVPLVLGTDSLASNADLNVWNEAEFFLKKNLFPANALLRMATVNGAAVLGLSGQTGRLEKGARFCYTTFPREMTALFR